MSWYDYSVKILYISCVTTCGFMIEIVPGKKRHSDLFYCNLFSKLVDILVLFIFIFHFLLQTKQEALQSFYNLSRNSFTLLNFLDFFKLIDRQMRLMQLIMNLPQLQRSVRTLPVLRIISRWTADEGVKWVALYVCINPCLLNVHNDNINSVSNINWEARRLSKRFLTCCFNLRFSSVSCASCIFNKSCA